MNTDTPRTFFELAAEVKYPGPEDTPRTPNLLPALVDAAEREIASLTDCFKAAEAQCGEHWARIARLEAALQSIIEQVQPHPGITYLATVARQALAGQEIPQ